MAEKLTDYDPADALKSDEAVEVFLVDAFETGNAAPSPRPWASWRGQRE